MSLANELVEAVSAWPEVEAITLGGSRATGDNDEKSDPVTPEMDVVYAFNGRAASVQQLPAYGITAAGCCAIIAAIWKSTTIFGRPKTTAR